MGECQHQFSRHASQRCLRCVRCAAIVMTRAIPVAAPLAMDETTAGATYHPVFLAPEDAQEPGEREAQIAYLLTLIAEEVEADNEGFFSTPINDANTLRQLAKEYPVLRSRVSSLERALENARADAQELRDRIAGALA